MGLLGYRMFKPEIIIGPPGCGKTHALLDRVAKAITAGVQPDRIGYMAFTRKAANEAVERASERFNADLPYFRTLHSIAFRALGLKKSQTLNTEAIRNFGEIMGIRITGKVNAEDGNVYGSSVGDRALFISGLSRIRCVSLEEQWHESPEDTTWFEVERIHRGLGKFKKSRGLIDFTDMLGRYITSVVPPDLDLLVVDEAQDLSKLQWKMVEKMATKAKVTVVAGDDDQAIFRWAGADIEYFINLTGEVKVLDQSYRTPISVQKQADKIIVDVKDRREKVWKSREEEGTVSFHTRPDAMDMSEGTWLILARNEYLLDEVEEHCRRQGFIYDRGQRRSVSAKTLATIRGWEELRKGGHVTAVTARDILRMMDRTTRKLPESGDLTMSDLHVGWGTPSSEIWHEAFTKMSLIERTYLLAALRRGEKTTKRPRIQLSTIHSAKGGEAENVVLYLDMARRTYNEMLKNREDEQRVFYVGVTRTINNLYIISPRTKFYFPMA